MSLAGVQKFQSAHMDLSVFSREFFWSAGSFPGRPARRRFADGKPCRFKSMWGQYNVHIMGCILVFMLPHFYAFHLLWLRTKSVHAVSSFKPYQAFVFYWSDPLWPWSTAFQCALFLVVKNSILWIRAQRPFYTTAIRPLQQRCLERFLCPYWSSGRLSLQPLLFLVLCMLFSLLFNTSILLKQFKALNTVPQTVHDRVVQFE